MNTLLLGVELTEWVGYLAMTVLLVSFMMRNVTKLRIINSVGCLFFVVYGLLISQYPIVITNLAIILINFYYLFLKKN
ncbi:MAG: uroporphyrinogen decarboxylase [Flavobacteriaceae bacterium]|tara:strand:+ start:297 stop:530 length:234 start_codon:yes stop_codon:yes gene_type:complete